MNQRHAGMCGKASITNQVYNGSMKLTKYEHACFTLEKGGQVLVVDPGVFTNDLGELKNVSVVVITHEHPDHFVAERLQELANDNPEMTVVAHESITSQLSDFRATSVTAGQKFEIGNFKLEFFGGTHAIIHPTLPAIANLGVLINNTLYYPGDSFTLPKREVKVLALPIGAPWLKMSETIDFVMSIKPEIAFPTHDAVLSNVGKSIPDRYISNLANENGFMYQRLTGSIEI